MASTISFSRSFTRRFSSSSGVKVVVVPPLVVAVTAATVVAATAVAAVAATMTAVTAVAVLADEVLLVVVVVEEGVVINPIYLPGRTGSSTSSGLFGEGGCDGPSLFYGLGRLSVIRHTRTLAAAYGRGR